MGIQGHYGFFSTDVEKKIKFLENCVPWAEYSNTCDSENVSFYYSDS